MAQWARRKRRRRTHAASIYWYVDRTDGAAQASPDPYTHDEPDAIVTALVQMEVSTANEEGPAHDAG
jgi:hypothetical protein